ncbi:MAG: hypothetical protein COA92_04810 [Sulfurovum sp.]|nr:MAG: hypothetical protein COA92_04810 [Sulfurovum sp.]
MKKIIVILFFIVLSVTVVFAKKNESKKPTKFKCDKSKYCKHMSSCEEAKFLLNQCGMKRLDRDKDGVPCENICSGG